MKDTAAQKAAAAEAEAALEKHGCADEQEPVDLAIGMSLSETAPPGTPTAAAPAPHIIIYGVPASGAPSVSTIIQFPDGDEDDSDGDSEDDDGDNDENDDDGKDHHGDDDSGNAEPTPQASRPQLLLMPMMLTVTVMMVARLLVSSAAFSATQP